ncbi:MAG: helix-turn-helix domain-containing protein [Saprospiraceae bacterium]
MNQVRQQIETDVSRSTRGVYCYTQEVNESNIPMYSHDKGKLIYTESGTVYVITEQKNQYLLPRHFIWIPSGIMHSIQGDNTHVIIRTLFFQNQPEDHEFFKQIGVYPMNDLLLEMINYTKNWKGAILPEDQQRYTFVMAIKAILPELSKQKLPFELPVAKDNRLKMITAYLQDNLSSPLHLSEIATQFGLSERSLARLFQSDLRMSYIKYLRTLRIIHALELLATTKLSINEIAFKVGYDSFPTFSNMFHQMVGVRPKTYLQQKS